MLANAVYFKIHIIAACLGFAAFFAASISAVLFLIQDDAIKKKRRGIISSRLPSLWLLDKLNYRAIGLGFPMLTLSIFCGLIWFANVHGVFWSGYNHRVVFSVILWLIYAVILHMRLSERMRGRKVAYLSILAFFVIILSLFGRCP